MEGKANLLKVYISETDTIGSTPLYEVIVKEAREAGMGGATVNRGILSFGASHSKQTSEISSLSHQIPIVVEIVDEEELIKKFAKRVQELISISKKGALVTIQTIEIVEYRPGDKYNQFRTF